jgi:hypothetical protein
MAFPVFAPGNVLAASDMNAVGLWLVKTQTIGTTVSSVTVTDVFSADYDNYKVLIRVAGASTLASLRLTLGSTATGYYNGTTGRTYANADSSSGVANGTSWFFSQHGSDGGIANGDIFSPFLADQSAFAVNSVTFATNASMNTSAGYLNDTTSYTAFTLTTSTGTITGGEIRVYGYRN